MAWPIPQARNGRWLCLTVLTLLPIATGPGASAQSGWRPGRQPAVPPPARTPSRPQAREQEGSRLVINGLAQQARWQWLQSDGAAASQLWLPLEVLQGQLGFSSESRPDGGLELEWFGQTLKVAPAQLRSLDDEVGLDVGPTFAAAGVRLEATAETLKIEIPPAGLVGIRVSSAGGTAAMGGRRVVLDLDGIALVRQESGQLLLGLRSTAAQRAELQGLGFAARQSDQGLTLQRPGVVPKVLTLGGPARVVLDLAGVGLAGTPGAGAVATPPPRLDPRLQALLSSSVTVERQVRAVGNRRMLINSVRLDPRRNPLELRLLTRPDGMQGLSSLPALAARDQALVAINGGFFNRIRRMPLGALKEQDRWLSGPILNRGAVGWRPRELPQFGRLRLEEWLTDETGRRWPLTTVNSGYVQRGLARYTADWGSGYRPLSGAETAVLIRGGIVQRQWSRAELAQGVGLGAGDTLVVARAGAVAPWPVGSRLSLNSRPLDAVGMNPFVLGGGPLLLQDGRLVLNGTAEGFGAAFQQQGAPRTVVGSDGRQLWLLTVQGEGNAGPTLQETAGLLRQMGLRDALNLDGGGSTGLMVGGAMTVLGRGVSASIHNGLGLVPRDSVADSSPTP